MPRLLLLFCITLSACNAGSGEGLDASGRPIGETPDPTDLPTLANIQARVFTPICTQCHIGAAAPQGLRLDVVNSFNDLVGVRSREVGSLFRVSPSDPDNSYLVQKIQGSAAVGAQMPLGGPPLPADDILLIRQWIADGAAPIATTNSGVTKVVSVESGAPIPGMAHVIRVLFSNDLDATTIHNTSIIVHRSSDDVFGNDDDIIEFGHIVMSSVANRRAIEIGIPYSRNSDNWYRVAISPEGSAIILDASGLPVQPYQVELR